MKRALVTGGAGFLGSHLAERLLDDGLEVVCLDNLVTGNEDNVTRLESRSGFRFIQHDVTKFIDVPQQFDIVFHLASPASPRDYLEMPIPTLKVGSLGTHNALGLAMSQKARFVLASTSEIYGDPKESPQREDYWGNVNPVGPRGVYDEAKRFAEAITMAYRRYHGVDARIVRIFNTYGPRMRPSDGRAVSNFIVQALGGEPLTIYGTGEQTRSFCYVSDLIDGIMKLAEAPPSEAMDIPFNIGNPQEQTVEDLARRILRLSGSSSSLVRKPLPVDDPKVRCPDIGRARQHLGWAPVVDIESGLATTIESFRAVLNQ